MSFVNEYIKNSDIHKYNIIELWNNVKPFNKLDAESDCEIKWTIDADRGMFLIRYGQARDCDWQGWLFVFQDQVYKIALNRVVLPLPLRVIRWELVRIGMPDENFLSREEFINYLKEALLVFGRNGVVTEGDKRYSIEFTF